MAQMKAKENEMKQEKKDERQVRTSRDRAANLSYVLLTYRSAGWMRSARSEPRRRKRSDTKSWPKRCTRSASSVSSARRSATSSSTLEQDGRQTLDQARIADATTTQSPRTPTLALDTEISSKIACLLTWHSWNIEIATDAISTLMLMSQNGDHGSVIVAGARLNVGVG